MIESEFRIVFWLIAGMAALVGVMVLLGMIFHVAIFGTIFGLIFKGLRESSGGSATRKCAHCGSVLPENAKICPSCGAPVN